MMKLSCSSLLATAILFDDGTTNHRKAIAATLTPDELSSLPWESLKGKITSTTVLYHTDINDYLGECLPEFDKPIAERSNHFLIDQESGLCVPTFFCGMVGCNPFAHNSTMSYDDVVSTIGSAFITPDFPYPESPLDAPGLKTWIDPSNPSYGLPYKVLFPRSAGDVVAAVDFANEHKLELSVKNSGHSFAGSSTKKNTLMINTNQYKKYSSTDTGIILCNHDEGGGKDAILSDLSNQPCSVALSRDKPAVLHIGAGENFDKVLRSVRRWNEDNKTPEGHYKLHMVAGAAGTVSPFGWSFMAGLPGTTGGRLFGFGVDQIVQLEMVLPTGEHVRFGPTSWEDADGFDTPRTTEVTGVCNENLYEEDESNWVWSSCETDINFADLWFAQRGGGGGTWGVVLSMYVQLHHWPGFLYEFSYGGCGATVLEAGPVPLKVAFNLFLIDFLVDPENIGLTQEQSRQCTAPNNPILICYGYNSTIVGDVVKAWRDYMDSKSLQFQDDGVSLEDITNFKECVFNTQIEPSLDWTEKILFPVGHPFEGQADDGQPSPFFPSVTHTTLQPLVPETWILENKTKAANIMLYTESPYIASFAGPSTSDQADSLPESYRKAAFFILLQDHPSLPTLPFFDELFLEMYDTTNKTNFPAFHNHNHIGPATFGPLKSDWSKPCPSDWPHHERNKKCVSPQEMIFGTKLLNRLESIKKEVDPNNIFDCYRCVSNDGEYNLEETSPNVPLLPSAPTPVTPVTDQPTTTSAAIVVFGSSSNEILSFAFGVLLTHTIMLFVS